MYIRSAIDGLEGDHQGSLAAFALWHLSDARVVRSSRQENGVTRDELVEAITHLAFYAGWPSAVTAVGVAREVLQKR